MDNFTSDYLVPLYFIVGTLSLFFLSSKFLAKKTAVMKNFGLGLGLYGLAMLIWLIVVVAQPDNLGTLTTVGAIPFGFAHLFFLMAAADKLNASKKSMVFGFGAAYLAVLFLLRVFVFESDPDFSENGLFYFNPEPEIVALYIGAFAGSLLPAITAVSNKMKDKSLAFMTRIGFTTLTMGAIVLVSSYDDNLQMINGWIMGAAFAVLVYAYSTKQLK